MKVTFGEELESFARSNDILRSDEFDKVLKATRRYLKLNFSITKVERLTEAVYMGKPHLAPTLDMDDRYESYPVRDDRGQPFGLNAHAFVRKASIWVIPVRVGETLDQAEAYKEMWKGDAKALPRYVRLPDEDGSPRDLRPTSTLISIPIVKKSSTESLVYFESDGIMHPSERSKDELTRIAKSIARLYELAEQNKSTHRATGDEISDLEEWSRQKLSWDSRIPSLFLAYPKAADPEVADELKRQLKDLQKAEAIRLFDWQENALGGRIPQTIEEEIRCAEYFVGYLSEPQPSGGDLPYMDNPNVMYEAGVFQGLANDPSQRANDWLLIRESNSPPPPFDLSTVNMVFVSRSDAGELVAKTLKENLEKRLAKLMRAAPRGSQGA